MKIGHPATSQKSTPSERLSTNVYSSSHQKPLEMHLDAFHDISWKSKKMLFLPTFLENQSVGSGSKVHAGGPDLRHSIALYLGVPHYRSGRGAKHSAKLNKKWKWKLFFLGKWICAIHINMHFQCQYVTLSTNVYSWGHQNTLEMHLGSFWDTSWKSNKCNVDPLFMKLYTLVTDINNGPQMMH